MDHDADVIVIGAGLGGLVAAVTMASRGMDVLVLERNTVPGGCATSFVRGRFEFEVSLHEMSGVGRADRPGRLYPFLEELGVLDRVELVRTRDFHRSVFPDLDITMPVGREAYRETLCRAFPASADGIRRFLAEVHRTAEEVSYFYPLMVGPGLPSPGRALTLPVKTASMMRYALVSWGQVLERYVDDPAPRAVLSQIWSYLGLPPSSLSFTFMASAVASFVDVGPQVVRGRSQALSSALVDLLAERGGTIRLRCPVERITHAGGRVTGVVTAGGEELRARFVLSNVDPVTTCSRLLDADDVGSMFWHRLRSNVVGTSTFNVYLGLARPAAELGLADHEVFINEDYDVEGRWAKLRRIGPPGELTLTSFNAVLPDISPPGTGIVVLTTLVYGEPWLDVPPRDYVATKNRLADHLMRRAETLMPGLRDATEVVEVSTPITNMRYLGQAGGAVYGFEQVPGETTLFRPGHGGPLGGLYFTGAFTQPGGGFEPAMMSGCMAGRRVARDAGAWS